MAVSSVEDESQSMAGDRPEPALRGRRGGDAPHIESESPVVRAGERLVRRIEALVEEIARLRADNDELHQQVRDAVAMLDRASSAVGDSRPRRRRRAIEGTLPAAAPARRRRPRSRAAKGRATPPEVTTEVVRAVIAKLGQGTAAEIASEITKAGVKVSGRAVRFLAERAGAETSRGDDGQRRYRL